MKKSISLIICLCLIFCFTVPIHASPTSWDTSDQSNLLNIMRAVTSYGTSNLYYYVSQINSNVNTIKTDISTIKGYLFADGHNIAYWTSAISSWMSPIYNAIVNQISSSDLEHIIGGLNLITGDSSSGYTYTPFLYYNNKSNAQWVSEIQDYFKLNSYPTYYRNNPNTTVYIYRYNGGNSLNVLDYTPANTPILASLWYGINSLNMSTSYGFQNLLTNYNSQQTATNWGSLGTAYFTPLSGIDGIYKWLSAIQTPVARLSYVLASDADIEAREASALNQQAVVDNFIDSNGDASASVSDYTSIADLSSGFSTNISTDASPSGFWDIFNSSHGTWFSQETYNQLDTTTPTRGSSFDTPYLDNNIQEIYNIIGGDDNK